MPRAMFGRALAMVLALAIPVLAAPALSKDNGPVKTSITLSAPASIGGKQLKPGQYVVVADESKVTLKADGRTVAEAPVQWMDAKDKFESSSVVLDGGNIHEIRFGGKSRYVVVR